MVAIESFDIPQIFVDLLNDNWIITNVAKPTIGLVENYKRINVKNGDYIMVYESAGLSRIRGDVQWSSEDIGGNVKMDIRTTSKTRLNDLYTEVQRILYANRIEPATGWHKLEDSNRVNLTNKAVGLYRYVLDYRIVARKKII